MKLLFLVLAVSIIVTACGGKPLANLAAIEANAASAAQPSSTAAETQLTSETVFNALKAANLPMTDVEVYTEETDTNHLLGRPHQYVGKVNWADTRAKDEFEKNPNTIEVFTNAEDLRARKTYIDAISKASPMFNQYIYDHKNVLVRLSHKLLPKDASEYERILKSL